jgi:hypothetical protein
MLVRTIRVVVGQEYISMIPPPTDSHKEPRDPGAARITGKLVVRYLSISSFTTTIVLFFTASRTELLREQRSKLDEAGSDRSN